jgi:hypothetical protein
LLPIHCVFRSRRRRKRVLSDNGKITVGAANSLHEDFVEWKARKTAVSFCLLTKPIRTRKRYAIQDKIEHEEQLRTFRKVASYLMNRRPPSHVPAENKEAELHDKDDANRSSHRQHAQHRRNATR